MLAVGTAAPEFTLPDAYENEVSLKDFRGKKVILWFFPKANTPGCTAEGQGFRDEFQDEDMDKTAIIGMSADPPARQRSFVESQGFQFPMLCDESREVLKAYHAWGKKKLYGREYEGILRISYVIDEQGIIEKAYAKVKTKTHAADVCNYLKTDS